MCAFDQTRCAFGQLRKPNPNHNLTLTLKLTQYPNPDPRPNPPIAKCAVLLTKYFVIRQMLRNFDKVISVAARLVKRAIDQMRTTAIPSEAIHSRKITFLSKLQLSDNIFLRNSQKVGIWRTGQFVLHLCCYLLKCYNGYWLLFLFFLVYLVKYFIIFDFWFLYYHYWWYDQ